MVVYQDSSVSTQLTLHLDQELGLDATRSLALVLVPGAAQRVHLIDEDDGGFLLAGQVKQVLHQSDRNKEDKGHHISQKNVREKGNKFNQETTTNMKL